MTDDRKVPASEVQQGQLVRLYDWPEVYEVVKVQVSLSMRRPGAPKIQTVTLSFPCDQEFTLAEP